MPAVPLPLYGDPTRLAQVIGNLLDHAGKFTPAGGTICITAGRQAENAAAVVTVSDTETGIHPALLPRIWEAFTQADCTLDRSRGGLGLGLALVKGLIELHGGSVEVRSGGPDRGSEFVLALPLQLPDRAPEAVPRPETGGDAGNARAAPPPETGRDAARRVLVIEDNRDAAESLRDLLELSGYRVELAGSGPEGIAMAERIRPEVVLCDIGLPGMDGYTVAARLAGSMGHAGLRRIAVSGYDGADVRRRSREAGFVAHLAKPVDPAELLELLG